MEAAILIKAFVLLLLHLYLVLACAVMTSLHLSSQWLHESMPSRPSNKNSMNYATAWQGMTAQYLNATI